MKGINIFINFVGWLTLINAFYILLFVDMEIRFYFFITIAILFLMDMLKDRYANQDKEVTE